MTRTWKLTALVAVLAVSACGGCGVVAKPVVGAITGAKGVYLPIPPSASAPAPFTDVTFEPFGNDVPTLVPGEFPGLVADALAKVADKSKLLPNPPAGAARRTLIVRGRYIHYQPKAEAVARVELVDGTTNTVIATAHCAGRGDTMTNTGTGALANGMAKAIRKFIGKTLKAEAAHADEDDDKD